MGATISGGCACGSVRYECAEAPIAQMLCHCRDCQRASGSAFAALLVVASDSVSLTGQSLKQHAVKGVSGRTLNRRFCGECGSPIGIARPETPQVEFLHAASLDDPAAFDPTLEVWMSSTDEWHPRHPRAQKFDHGPGPALRSLVEAHFNARSAL